MPSPNMKDVSFFHANCHAAGCAFSPLAPSAGEGEGGGGGDPVKIGVGGLIGYGCRGLRQGNRKPL